MKETLARHDEEFAAHNKQFAEDKEQLMEHKNIIAILQNQVKILSDASADYRKVRHRVFDKYRRDVKHNLDEQGRARLKEGNESAQDPDVFLFVVKDLTKQLWRRYTE
jgi:hypothetical protein